MNQPQSFLARHQGKPAITDAQLDAMAARAWLDFGIVLLRPEELPNPFDRQAVLNIAEKRFGKRHDGK